jgi:hypothetical protein
VEIPSWLKALSGLLAAILGLALVVYLFASLLYYLNH